MKMARQRRRWARRTVRASRIELVDDTGRLRVDVGAVAGGGVGLRILDEHGVTRVWLGLDPSGPVLAMGRDGNVAAELGVHDDLPELHHVGAYAYLADAHGTPRRGLWLDDRSTTTHDL